MKTKKPFGILALIAIITSLSIIDCKQGDGDGEPSPETPGVINVTGVSLNKSATGLLVNGTTETLYAAVVPEYATNQNITWSSSNTSIATVSNGVIKGVGAGKAIITVTTVDGNKTATCTVDVSSSAIAVQSITLNKTTTSITLGETETFKATITPANATSQNITWSSSDDTSVTVSTLGVVTGVSNGTATITAKTTETDGSEKSATCTVTVADYCNSYTAFKRWLDKKPANNSSSAYTVKVKISDPGNLGNMIGSNSNKYVILDLSGSTFTGIWDYTFSDCSNLTGITLPASVTSIGREAFYGCGLTSITIPRSVTSIDNWAFRDCNSLTSVTFATGSNISDFGNLAFPEGFQAGDNLKFAYFAGGAGTYTRESNGYNWTKSNSQ